MRESRGPERREGSKVKRSSINIGPPLSRDDVTTLKGIYLNICGHNSVSFPPKCYSIHFYPEVVWTVVKMSLTAAAPTAPSLHFTVGYATKTKVGFEYGVIN